jgi:hypothetical protein
VRSIQKPPIVEPTPRKKMARVKVVVTSVLFQWGLACCNGLTKTLQA